MAGKKISRNLSPEQKKEMRRELARIEKKKRKKSEAGYRFMVTGARGILRLLVLVLVLIVIAWMGRAAYRICYAVVKEAPADEAPGKTAKVTIPEDANVREVAYILYEAEMIDNQMVFVIQERLSGHHGDIKPGTYEVNSSYTPNQICAVLSGEKLETEEDEEAGDT